MEALANLSKFLGMYEHWQNIKKSADLKWEKRSGLETVLNILNSNLEDIEAWLKEIIEKLPKKYAAVLAFAALTGLRPSEACDSCKLISELSEEGKLNDYLNKELMMLEHFKYKEVFLRGCKNAYISFVTEELLELVKACKPKFGYTALKSAIRKRRLGIKTKELRKLFGTKLREYLPSEMIDLLQGRVSSSVFLRFYYKPMLLNVQKKTLEALKPLENELMARFTLA